MTVTDQNGNRLYKRVARESDGTWGVNVWWGGGFGPATTLRRYYYATRRQAMDGNISDNIGDRGVCSIGGHYADQLETVE